ncbi:MAG: MBL fold metallo-hydrolase, partial [Candidatus Thermoplasmatota archaeon]
MFIRFACWNALALTLTIIILVGFLPFGIQTTAINNQALLEIYVIDVGQGDSTLIISPTNITMLIDGGNDGCGNNTILPLLNTLGITSLNYIVVTHYHEDHIGGLDEVINAIGITDYVYDRGYSYTTPAYQDYVKAASNKRKTITDGEIIDLGGGAIAKCVSVNGNGVVDPTTASENDLCIALVITFGYFD